MNWNIRPCMVVHHIPSGIKVKIDEQYRMKCDSHIARDLALKILKGKLWVLNNCEVEFSEEDIKFNYELPEDFYLTETENYRTEIFDIV